MTETRLHEDRWFVQNTLPYVIPYLSLKDLLNVSQTSRLYDSIIREYYLDKTYVPLCYKHNHKILEGYGAKIRRLQLIPNEDFKGALQVSRALLRIHVDKNESQPRQLLVQKQSNKYPGNVEFIEKLEELTHFRFYTSSYSLIYIGNSCCTSGFCWSSLLSLKSLKCLELGFHIPSTFGSRILIHLTTLEVLKLHMYTGIDEHLFEAVSNLKHIKEFVVLKTAVNNEKFTVLIRAPCDTNYALLLKTVLKLNRTLRQFLWVLNDVTICDAFFGQNCQTFLNLNNVSALDKSTIEQSLTKRFANTKIYVETDTEYFLNIKKSFKRCFECNRESSISELNLF